MTSVTAQRIDKWLWHARVTKTRSLATALVSAGSVRVDGQRVTKPAQSLKPGNVLTIVLDGSVRILEVASFVPRRGDASLAATTYVDHSPPRLPKAMPDEGLIAGPRPSKRERRAAARVSGKPLN